MGKPETTDQPEKVARRGRGRPTLSSEQLLDTALDLFLRNGFEQTGIDTVAAAAGMAKRTVYARYADKTALFKAALARAIENWIIPVERLRSAECDDLEQTLLRIGEMLMANILSPAGLQLLRLSNAVSVRMPEIAAYNTQMGTEPTLAYLAELFQRRLLPPEAPSSEAREAAFAFLYLVVGGPASTAAWGFEYTPEATERHTRYCVHLFLHGTLPTPHSTALEEENQQLKAIIKSAASVLAGANDSLQRPDGRPDWVQRATPRGKE